MDYDSEISFSDSDDEYDTIDTYIEPITNNAQILKAYKNITIPNYPQPTDISLATISGISKLNTGLNLRVLSYLLVYPNIISGVPNRLYYPRIVDLRSPHFTINRIQKKSKKNMNKPMINFFNQITVRVVLRPGLKQMVNVKIFRSGALQMTGIKSIDDHYFTCNTVKNTIKDLAIKMNAFNNVVCKLQWAPIDINIHHLLMSFRFYPNRITKNNNLFKNYKYINNFAHHVQTITYSKQSVNLYYIGCEFNITLFTKYGNSWYFHITLPNNDNIQEAKYTFLTERAHFNYIKKRKRIKKTERCRCLKEVYEPCWNGYCFLDSITNIIVQKHQLMKCIRNFQLKYNKDCESCGYIASDDQLITEVINVKKHMNLEFLSKYNKVDQTYNVFFTPTKYPDKLIVTDVQETMFNGLFKTNFPINRHVINELYCKKYELNSTFGDSNHQGVITRYNWNENNLLKDGICYCDEICTCKTLTIITFGPPKKNVKNTNDSHNSSILITGGRTLDQQRDVYLFINNVLKNNYKNIYKINVTDYVKIIRIKRNVKFIIKQSLPCILSM